MSNFGSLVFYITAFIISTFLICKVEKIYKKEEIKNKKLKIMLFSGLALAIPIIIAGLRFEVGTDYNTYIDMYKVVERYTLAELLSNKTEILFGLIIKIAVLFNNSQIVFWISSIITVITVYLALLDNKEKIPLSLAVLVYLFSYFPNSLNIVRQAIAVSIILYSYKYIFSKNIYKFAITVLLATMFHTTAFLFFPFYFIVNSNSKSKLGQIVKMLSIVVMIIVIMNYNYILGLLANFDVFQKYENYGYLENVGGNRMLILDTIVLALVLLYKKPLERYNERNKVYIFMMIVGYIFGMTAFISPYIKRIALYFNISTIYVLSTFPKIAINKNEKVIVESLIIFYVIIKFIISAYILGQADIIPYKIIGI